MMIKKILKGKKGQGLVEYALILVLVAIVVMIILALLGPAIGNVFSNIVAALEDVGGGSNRVTGVSVSYTPPSGPAQSRLRVTVSVSGTTDVTLSGTVSGTRANCSGSCQFTFTGVPSSGSVTASGGGSSRSTSW